MTQKGFTLIELLIVVLILGVLATIAIARIFRGQRRSARINVCETNRTLINRQIELFYIKNNRYPLHLIKVLEDPNFFPDGRPRCPFMEPWVIDSKSHRVLKHNH